MLIGRGIRLFLTVAFGGASISAHGSAQQSAPPRKPEIGQSSPASGPDVVVEGLREAGPHAIARIRSAVPSALGYRKVAERSDQFVGCLGKLDPKAIAPVLDEVVNTPAAQRALDQVIRRHIGCYPGYPTQAPPPPFFGDCNPTLAEDVSFDTANGPTSANTTPFATTCRAFYDRGALLLAAIDQFQPGLALTTQQTSDPAVQARFDVTEGPRNRLRYPEDFQYLTIAVCLVRVQPVLAGRLVHAEDDRRLQDRIGRLILFRGRTCVGNAERVRAEPVQLRIYIADAFYRWAAAARAVTSLLASKPAS